MVGAFAIYGPLSRSGAEPVPGWPRPDWARLRRLVALGLPAAIQVTLEVGVFATATALAGRLDAASLASHQIVLNISSLTYMVPLGIASAGAVRVGQALGRGDPKGGLDLGLDGLADRGRVHDRLGGRPPDDGRADHRGLHRRPPGDRDHEPGCSSWRRPSSSSTAIQVVATGVLRGAGDTRTSMACNLLAHWGIGLPIGYALAFGMGRGIVGLWVGLSIGLGLAGLGNLAVWARKARQLREGRPIPSAG